MTNSPQKYTRKSCNIDGLKCFNPRQYRQTVTGFIKDSFNVFRLDDSMDLLYSWLGLYKAANAITEKSFVHRDLSCNNVLLRRPQQDSQLSIIIIAFSLPA